ncbi:hypothetical protein J2Q11_13665 [Tenacibaculum finnmarkense genomovar finnmarkense]|uniref:hypothetical protein n=1 Tax=Tenacibaculum finnmarkense TaxID=2781243 RepID=UPI001E5B4369|nr:hypothetical protein [Tenacibaculum finnmarkense]MCD8418771.1 hypothetical protein [Tenacibaculum finnmarkense genomovar finnmarkense]MCG8187069.1 hypothetical protein [Tenacibaculum finnmarkense genomovar finnmarkense]MCG8203621.1 hypothetical protein [Tenacibaculum finnmarkense genomovar finnmarkense]MCG8211104.1 hypothetical protein [Tenacibaculum finnmarkense genomovar finnmarkense]MCG8213859.1 hypothetical protein [Tenacibaculum finnmarkense genomovar finnmarkense]
MNWKDDKDLKLKLSLKYTFYYLSVAPSFSILSAISSFPLLNPVIGDFDKIFSFQILIVYALTDIIIFITSFGKYHIIDYLVKLDLNGYPFFKKPMKFLYIVYLFFGLLIISNIYSYKYDLTFSSIGNSISQSLVKEQYPDDLFYGQKVFSLRDNSENVFSPSKPLSFIYKQKLPQKTLYLNLPEEVFNSESERKAICLNLIEKSYRNDLFSDFKPRQTRLVLSNIKRGKFLEYYNYFYIYYFDNERPEWSIYAGIEADSITMKNYINFNYDYNKGLLNKAKIIEEKLKLPWDEIVEQSENNIKYKKEIMTVYNSSINSTLYYNKLVIAIDTSKLELKRINFSEAKLNGWMSFNLPISDLEQRVNLTNYLNGELIEYDKNVDYLKLLREETTNKGI